MRTSNQKCKQFVERCQSFTGNNLNGHRISDTLYVVYSYGWWPIYAKINNQWYGHKEKYSVTTSKHQSQAMPYNCDIHWLDNVQQLRDNITAVKD